MSGYTSAAQRIIDNQSEPESWSDSEIDQMEAWRAEIAASPKWLAWCDDNDPEELNRDITSYMGMHGCHEYEALDALASRWREVKPFWHQVKP